MRFLIIFVIFSTFVWSQDLDSHRWKERVLILQGGSDDYERIEKQFNQIRKFEKKLVERKLVLYKCIETKCTYYDWKENPKTFRLQEPTTDFSLTLIGLDGTKKYESKKNESPNIIFDLIDVMPMRKSEIKRSKNE